MVSSTSAAPKRWSAPMPATTTPTPSVSPEEMVGAHARHYNAHSIGVCYEGGLDEKGRAADTRTPAQKKALLTLLLSLKQDYPDAEIVGHCELEGVHKACPCFSCSEYRDYFKHLR